MGNFKFQTVRAINLSLAVASGVLVSYFLFQKLLGDSFSTEGFMPHGHCYLWSPPLLWTMFTTDLLIGLAYVTISICLYVLVRRIRLPFSSMFLAFGVFIAACGATHFMEVYTIWHTNYWLAAVIKVITAVASVATAIILFPLFPKVVQFAAAARLSEERKSQLELINQELEKKTAELTALNKELEAFSYSVSHDLRSPLRGINGFSEALMEDHGDQLSPEAREYLEYIRSGSQKMGRIIDDMLNLSRVSRAELKNRLSDLSAFARDTLAGLQLREPDRKVDVFIQQGIQVEGDPGLLRIVIDNLLTNAWKFTRKSVGARIEFGAQEAEGELVCFVRDNGAGFDMSYADKLFQPFQRLHKDDEFEGTGIGLATVHRILTRHHGKIWVESELGRGTTFYFKIGRVK